MINRTTLLSRMKKLGLHPKQFSRPHDSDRINPATTRASPFRLHPCLLAQITGNLSSAAETDFDSFVTATFFLETPRLISLSYSGPHFGMRVALLGIEMDAVMLPSEGSEVKVD